MPAFVTTSLMRRTAIVAGAAAALFGLAACQETHLRLAPDFGAAVRQDTAAQIADPDAQYAGTPAPATDGARTTIAVTRYRTDKVIPPVSTQTSDRVQAAKEGNSGGSAGAPQ